MDNMEELLNKIHEIYESHDGGPIFLTVEEADKIEALLYGALYPLNGKPVKNQSTETSNLEEVKLNIEKLNALVDAYKVIDLSLSVSEKIMEKINEIITKF